LSRSAVTPVEEDRIEAVQKIEVDTHHLPAGIEVVRHRLVRDEAPINVRAFATGLPKRIERRLEPGQQYQSV